MTIKTVKQLYIEIKSEENYLNNNNLLPRLIELAMSRHMEKADKIECEPEKCAEFQAELQLALSELKDEIKDSKKENNNNKI